MQGADLHEAKLQGAGLLGANLQEANLRLARMNGANLRGANLKGSLNLSWEQLAECFRLRYATMPDAVLYDGRLKLLGDIEDACRDNVDIGDPTAMSKWYGVSLEEYQRGQEWAQEHGLAERKDEMLGYSIILKTIEPVIAATLRHVIFTYSDIRQLFAEVYACLRRHGVSPVRHMAIYHDIDYPKRNIDMEAAVPVGEWTKLSSEQITVRQLPGIELAASVVHRGSLDNLGRAHSAIRLWIGTSGYHIAGPIRDIYLIGPGSGKDSAFYVTEVVFPVERD